ncbi:MAG: NAD(P)/FAD-dependent oxidoreductase, partial [Anaerolineae bacterium]
MSKKTDVIIIGAGIIGCNIAFELCKKGYKTLNIEKHPAAGFGSTSNSCAIVRAHYSTFNGVSMAYENFFYWHNWEAYLGVEDERGYAKYMNVGTVLLKSQGHDHEKVLKQFDAVGVKYEEWTPAQLKERMPIFALDEYWPPRRPEDDSFWAESETELAGAVYTPESGYVSDPQLATHNLQRAAEAHGGKFLFNAEVVAIRRDEDRVLGVTLKSGEQIDAPIVVNVAGPHSFVINRMAGVEDDMNIKTNALRHEVHHVPSPPGFNFEKDGFHTSDGDLSIYFRPETGNSILVGSEDPECDPQEWVEDPDHYNQALTQ